MSEWSDSFYVTGGAMLPDAPCYVERQADTDLYEALRRGEFCHVLHARQMGKSSLLVRTAIRLREAAVDVVQVELPSLGQNVALEQWYVGLLASFGEQLDLGSDLMRFWQENSLLSPLQRWFAALRHVLLPACPGSLVVFLDEIDAVSALPFSTDEFFAAIRECYNRRAYEPAFQRLTFCLAGVATPTSLIRDPRTTPFNIGRRIVLTDFTAQEAAGLARGLVLGEMNSWGRTPAEAEVLLRRILYWTGGHPYLTQRLCREVAEQPGSPLPAAAPRRFRFSRWSVEVVAARHAGRPAEPVTGAGSREPTAPTAGSDLETEVDGLCRELFLEHGSQERDDNLQFVRNHVLHSGEDRAALLELYAGVWRGKRVRDNEANPLVSALRLSGIVRVSHGLLRVRNRIYERVFDREWAQSNMPEAELRRQRAAYRRGVFRATALAGTILLGMGGLLGTSIHDRRQLELRTKDDAALTRQGRGRSIRAPGHRH